MRVKPCEHVQRVLVASDACHESELLALLEPSIQDGTMVYELLHLDLRNMTELLFAWIVFGLASSGTAYMTPLAATFRLSRPTAFQIAFRITGNFTAQSSCSGQGIGTKELHSCVSSPLRVSVARWACW